MNLVLKVMNPTSEHQGGRHGEKYFEIPCKKFVCYEPHHCLSASDF